MSITVNNQFHDQYLFSVGHYFSIKLNLLKKLAILTEIKTRLCTEAQHCFYASWQSCCEHRNVMI